LNNETIKLCVYVTIKRDRYSVEI